MLTLEGWRAFWGKFAANAGLQFLGLLFLSLLGCLLPVRRGECVRVAFELASALAIDPAGLAAVLGQAAFLALAVSIILACVTCALRPARAASLGLALGACSSILDFGHSGIVLLMLVGAFVCIEAILLARLALVATESLRRAPRHQPLEQELWSRRLGFVGAAALMLLLAIASASVGQAGRVRTAKPVDLDARAQRPSFLLISFPGLARDEIAPWEQLQDDVPPLTAAFQPSSTKPGWLWVEALACRYAPLHEPLAGRPNTSPREARESSLAGLEALKAAEVVPLLFSDSAASLAVASNVGLARSSGPREGVRALARRFSELWLRSFHLARRQLLPASWFEAYREDPSLPALESMSEMIATPEAAKQRPTALMLAVESSAVGARGTARLAEVLHTARRAGLLRDAVAMLVHEERLDGAGVPAARLSMRTFGASDEAESAAEMPAAGRPLVRGADLLPTYLRRARISFSQERCDGAPLLDVLEKTPAAPLSSAFGVFPAHASAWPQMLWRTETHRLVLRLGDEGAAASLQRIGSDGQAADALDVTEVERELVRQLLEFAAQRGATVVRTPEGRDFVSIEEWGNGWK